MAAPLWYFWGLELLPVLSKSPFLRLGPEIVVRQWGIAAEIFISFRAQLSEKKMLSIPIVVMSCIPSTIFPPPSPHFLENDVVSETHIENTASHESYQGNHSLSPWNYCFLNVDKTSRTVTPWSCRLYSGWHEYWNFIYLYSAAVVVETPLQQFRYLSILNFWTLTKDLCMKLGSPACEHPAQIFLRIVRPWSSDHCRILILEFKFCPDWLSRVSERIWWGK